MKERTKEDLGYFHDAAADNDGDSEPFAQTVLEAWDICDVKVLDECRVAFLCPKVSQ